MNRPRRLAATIVVSVSFLSCLTLRARAEEPAAPRADASPAAAAPETAAATATPAATPTPAATATPAAAAMPVEAATPPPAPAAAPTATPAATPNTPGPGPTPTPGLLEAGAQEMEILAQRPVTAASSREVLREDLDSRSLFTPEDVFRVIPNLLVGQHAGGGKADQIFVRGFDADHGTDFALSVDGVPVNAVSHAHGQGYADIHFVIPETIDTIQVDRGPYRAGQGDFATAGSADFRLRDRFEAPFVSVGGGSFGTGRAVVGLSPQVGDGVLLLAGEMLATDGPFLEPQKLRRYNGLARWTAPLSPRTLLRVTGSTYSGAWNASGQVPLRAVESGDLDRFGAIDPTEGGLSTRDGLTARLDVVPGDDQTAYVQSYLYRYRLNLYSNFTFVLDDAANGDGIEQEDDRTVYGVDTAWSRADGPFFTTLGLSLRADVANVSLYHQTERVRRDPISRAGVRQSRRSAYVETTWAPVPWGRVVAGVRGDQFSFAVNDRLAGETGVREQAIASPKASVILSPVRGPRMTWDVFVNGGTGFHSNDARDVVRTNATVEVTPTTLPRAVGAEVGTRVRHRRFEASIAVWQLDLEKELVWVGDAGETDIRGASRRRGIETELRLAPTRGLRLDFDVSYADARFREDGSLVPLAPRVLASGGIAARDLFGVAGLEGSLRVRHVGDRPANEDFSAVADGYMLADLVAGYAWGGTSVQALLENVTDEKWREAQVLFESRLPGEPAPVEDIHFTPGHPRAFRLLVTRTF